MPRGGSKASFRTLRAYDRAVVALFAGLACAGTGNMVKNGVVTRSTGGPLPGIVHNFV